MARIPIAIPETLMPKKDLEHPCPCQDRPIETLFKHGIVFWSKAVGDRLEEGETVCEVEIEKKTAELATPVPGVLVEQTILDGGSFSYEDVLGYIEDESEGAAEISADLTPWAAGEGGPISLYLLSGFLGSGKTTLLKRLLAGAAGERVGVIVNEFGDVGVDGALLTADETKDVKMVEINGGSIFCACLKDGFVRTLKAFAEQPIDILFIENSGMSDPSSMNNVLKNLAPYLKRPYDYRGSVCMVDCTSFVKYVEAFMPLERQVEASSLVVLNKTDLVTREEIDAARNEALAINPEATIIEAVRAEIPPEVFRAELKNSGFDKKSLNATENRPETFEIADIDGVFEPDSIRAFAEGISDVTMRMKGFFRAADGMYYIDVSSGIVSVEKTDTPTIGGRSRTKIVVIARRGTEKEYVMREWRRAHGGE